MPTVGTLTESIKTLTLVKVSEYVQWISLQDVNNPQSVLLIQLMKTSSFYSTETEKGFNMAAVVRSTFIAAMINKIMAPICLSWHRYLE